MSENTRNIRQVAIDRLHERLAEVGVVVGTNGEHIAANEPRGGAYFMKFVPEETSFELLPDFPKYFQAAQRNNFLSAADANAIAYKSVYSCEEFRQNYRGRFRDALYRGTISEFLDRANDHKSLKLLESREDWFPDILNAQFRRPCVVDEHLRPPEFSKMRLSEDVIAQFARHPLRAFTAAVEIVAIGLWLGLTPADITTTLELLSGGSELRSVDAAPFEQKIFGEIIAIPCFSSGLQGVVAGFFCNLREEQKTPILNILSQFGECLAEQCALQRRSASLDRLRQHVDLWSIANAILDIASPIEHVVVSSAGEHFGYALCKEEDYLAGYQEKKGDEAAALAREPGSVALETHTLDPPARIYIRTLRGYAAVDPVFSFLRIKTGILDILSAAQKKCAVEAFSDADEGVKPLEWDELERHRIALQHQLGNNRGARVAAKRLSFIEMVISKFDMATMRLSNLDMLNGMSRILAKSGVKGYQVTGGALKTFTKDIENLLPRRFIFEPLNQSIVHVRWKKKTRAVA